MDYTLSTFLPECSLSNEPKVRTEIEGKIGLPPADSSVPLLMHLLISFMKGIGSSNQEEDKPSEPTRFSEPTGADPPVPSNLIPSEKIEEPVVQSKEILTAEEEVKSSPVNPI